MTEWDIFARACAAIVAGGLIGLERAYRGRAAGMRTNALVAFGAALLVGVAEYAGPPLDAGNRDPTRVIQGIVTGIGFLGAGVIVKEGFSVRGLTTAASVWVVSAIGILFGAGLYRVGAAATAIVWLRRGSSPVRSCSNTSCGCGRPTAALHAGSSARCASSRTSRASG